MTKRLDHEPETGGNNTGKNTNDHRHDNDKHLIKGFDLIQSILKPDIPGPSTFQALSEKGDLFGLRVDC